MRLGFSRIVVVCLSLAAAASHPVAAAATDPPPPKISTTVTSGGYVTVTGTTQGNADYTVSRIYVCISPPPTPPAKPAAVNCAPGAAAAAPAPASLLNAAAPGAPAYVTPNAKGDFTAILQAPPFGSVLNVSETIVSVAAPATTRTISSDVATIQAAFRRSAPLGAAAVGLEVTGASSTDPKAVFLATGIMDLPLYSRDDISDAAFWLTGMLRVSGMAQPQPLGKIGSTADFTTYLASAVNANPDQIVQSLDASFGVGWRIAIGHHRAVWSPGSSSLDVGNFRSYGFDRPQTLFTLSLIASYGAITPLSENQSQPVVYALTGQIYNQYNQQQPDAFKGCPTAPDNKFDGCYVAFVPYDRTHFYRNYQAGFRLKLYAGDYSEGQYRFPGVADLTIGQNEYVTGGKFREPVIHFGGVLPVPSVDALYIFGSMDVRASKSDDGNQMQLVLSPLDSATVQWTDPSVAKISVDQPNRDRYRIGIGLGRIDI